MEENKFSTTLNSDTYDLSDLYVTKDGVSETYNDANPDFKLESIREIVERANPKISTQFNLELYDAIINHEFEYGMLSMADRIFESFHNRAGVVAVDLLSDFFLSNISNHRAVLGVLQVLLHQKFQNIGHQGEMMLIIAVNKFKSDLQIQDAVIRVIENWEVPRLIDILYQVTTEQAWLLDYKNSVIEDLNSLCRTI